VLILLLSLYAQVSLKDGVQDICGSILLHAHIAQTISKHVPEQPLQPDVGLELLLPPMLALILLLLLMLQEWILPSIALQILSTDIGIKPLVTSKCPAMLDV